MNLNELILSELGIGKPKAVSLADIATRTDLALYEIEQRIDDMRSEGFIICSDYKGFYVPFEYEELKEYIERERAHIEALNKMLVEAERVLKLWGEGNG